MQGQTQSLIAGLRRSAILFCAVAGLLPGHAYTQANPADNQSARIHGVVVNSATHDPVPRALVLSPDRRFAILTDSQGRFEFKVNPQAKPGAQPNIPNALTAERPGFLQTLESTVTVTADGLANDLTIPLVPEARIIGRVTLGNSENPDRIRVDLYRLQVRDGNAHWEQAASADTRSSGEFRFADLAAGEYKVITEELLDRDLAPATIALNGYPPVYYPNATDFISAKTIELSPGMTAEADMTLVRHVYYPVKAIVTNAPPGSGLALTVSVQGHRGPGFALAYNIERHTIEGLLPDGIYQIDAYNFGQPSTSGVATISVRGGPSTGSLTLISNSSVSVDVKEEFSADRGRGFVQAIGNGAFTLRGPRTYLNVYLEPADDFGQERPAALRTPSANDDSMAIDNVAPGRYWVKVNSSRGYAASVTSGAIDLQHQPLVVGPSGTTSPIEITMRNEGAELDGAIDGAPQQATKSEPGLHVDLVPLSDSSGEFREVPVSPNGKFTSTDIPPGAYRVLAFDHAVTNFAYRDPDVMRAFDSVGIVVRLNPGDKEQVRVPIATPNE